MPVPVHGLGPASAGGFILRLLARDPLGTQQLEIIHELVRIFLRLRLVKGMGVFEKGIAVSETVRGIRFGPGRVRGHDGGGGKRSVGQVDRDIYEDGVREE